MSDLKCYIVRDLLPLYIDRVCSEETERDIEAHLNSCESCRRLHAQMKTDLPVEIAQPQYEEQKVFRTVRKDLTGILAALLVTISCFVMNFGSAWEGGPAPAGNFLVSLGYILFWTIFTVKARKFLPLLNLSLVVSCITLISSLAGVAARTGSLPSGFLMAAAAAFLAVPFYGLRWILEWSGVYLCGVLLSAVWVGYAFWMKYRLSAEGLPRKEQQGRYAIRRRLILTGLFLLSLSPMLLPQYGFQRGVQEISGMVNLFNPIGAAAVILYLLGVWCMFRRQGINTGLCVAGCVGMVASELFEFWTWHIWTITGTLSFAKSLDGVFPEFYLGLLASLAMAAAYPFLERKLQQI